MIVLEKGTGSVIHNITPLTWRPVRTGGPATASLVCSNGHDGLIDEHEIAEDGTVTPSVVCPHEGCGFHEYVQLNGWPDR